MLAMILSVMVILKKSDNIKEFFSSFSRQEEVERPLKRKSIKRRRSKKVSKVNEIFIPDSYPSINDTRNVLPDNLHYTINNNMRSAKITSKEQLRILRDEYGIETVINLALDSTYGQKCKKKGKKLCEEIWAEELDLYFLYVPLTNKGPTEEKWEIIKDELLHGNALVHCTHGADRTGAVVGRFRLEEMRLVEEDEVYEESLKYGFKAKDFRYPGGKKDPNKYLRQWMLYGEYDE